MTLTLREPPPPAVGAVVNTASLQPVISPGGIISIYGENLGPPVLSPEFNGEGLYPTTFGNTTVTINDTPAPLLYVSPSRIDVVAPYALAGQESARIVVSRYYEKSPIFEVPVSAASPALFTADSSGGGPGAILEYKYPNFIPNSVDNPASPGSVITLFGTGAGILDETIPEAGICMIATPFRAQPASLTIGGLPAKVLYAGPAPYQTVGTDSIPGSGLAVSPGVNGPSYTTIAKFQINAVVPDGVPSGPQPVVLTIGSANNEQQRVTIAIK
ncbi:MAG: hypothetical protein HY858_11685 [Candidatus Solibacter usitatus]|nr:hypothetical protein [Candidatus Solibacter usitatus]